MMQIDIDALAEQLTSAANIVTNDGYYELDTAAVAQCLDKALATTRAELAAMQEIIAEERELSGEMRAELAAKDAEIARLHALAKANNDLAKMHKAQVQEFRQSQLRLMNDLQACKDALAQWEGSHD